MLFALLSPAKKLDFKPAPDFVGKGALKPTQPALLGDAAALAARAKRYRPSDLRRLMDLSPTLANLNHERFQAFDPANERAAKPAIFAFNGDVYLGFQAKTLAAEDIAFAQNHIGILSGLYGLLRPLDLIQAYRLEMGSKVNTDKGKDLYAYWRDAVTAQVNAVTAKLAKPTIVNLASNEYWSAVDEKVLKAPVIQAAFKEIRGGKSQIVSFMAKKARGQMARFIVENRLADVDDLKAFDRDGYRFDVRASDDKALVFSRDGSSNR